MRSYKKFDLVKGEHRFLVFYDSARSLEDRDIGVQGDRYIEATGWNYRSAPRKTLHIVTLRPTVCIWDRGYSLANSSIEYAGEWPMTDDLYVVMLESADSPKPLRIEETAEGRRAHIDLPWGRLVLYPDDDRIDTEPLPLSRGGDHR